MLSTIILFTIALYCVIMMSAWDLRSRIIPDVYLWPFMLCGLMLTPSLPWIFGGYGEIVIAAAIGYLIGVLMNLIFKYAGKKRKSTGKEADFDPIGMGDIKLLSAGGIWLGVTGLSIAVVFGCVGGIIWAKVRRQKYVPFAPFFFAGMIVAIMAILLFGV